MSDSKNKSSETKAAQTKRKWNFKELIPGGVISLAACFMMFLYAPLELYFTNKDEFWFDMRILGPVLLKIFLVMLVLSIAVLAILWLIHRRVYQVALVVYFVGFICTYIQGNFLVSNLPAMDGTAPQWESYTGEHIKTIVVWIVVAVAAALAVKFVHMKKMYVVIGLVSGCMTLMLGVTLLSLCISNNGLEQKNASNLTITKKDEFEMSTNKNFVILLLDAVDGKEFNNIIEDDSELKSVFNDFTFYKNTMGTYPFTKHAIPYIISGEYYENERLFNEYMSEAYSQSPLLTRLKKDSYQYGIYEDEYAPADDSIADFDNTDKSIGTVTSELDFAKLEIKLAAFKYAPYSVKERCYFLMSEFQSVRQAPEGQEIFTSSNKDFYDDLNSQPITLSDQNCFRFIHVEGGHVPFQYDENVVEDGDGTYEGNVRASVTIAKTYLEKLKEASVYDNTVIIVMADHGYNYADTEGRQNPILLMKGVDEHHYYQVSNAPVSFEDLQEAYSRLLDGKASTECFDVQEGDQRDRRFLFYYFEQDEHMTEYIQKGEAKDTDQMQETGKNFELRKN